MAIRFLEEKDIKRIIEIYSYYIENTTVTFEYTVPSYDEFKTRFNKIQENYPFIVYEEKGVILGYAYASKQNERMAYSWNCSLSVYLDKNSTGNGVGVKLYSTLLDILKIQGYFNAYALVTVPNEKSFSLHKKMGFELESINKNTGFKFEKWIDVAQWKKTLRDFEKPTTTPLGINDIDKDLIYKIFEKYSK